MEQVCEAERRRGVTDHGDDVDQKVVYLLSNFDVPLPRTASEIESEIDRQLRDWVESANPEDVAAKRNELCGNRLAVKSADTVINPREFLRSVGFTAIPLRNWSLIEQRCLDRSLVTAERIVKYRKTEDVRQPPQWFPENSVLVLAGEGGAGKSWQLADR